MIKDDLSREYAQIAEALSNWFISQDIPVGRACGVMMYLGGVCIGHRASTTNEIENCLERHMAVMNHMAKVAFAKRGGR